MDLAAGTRRLQRTLYRHLLRNANALEREYGPCFLAGQMDVLEAFGRRRDWHLPTVSSKAFGSFQPLYRPFSQQPLLTLRTCCNSRGTKSP